MKESFFGYAVFSEEFVVPCRLVPVRPAYAQRCTSEDPQHQDADSPSGPADCKERELGTAFRRQGLEFLNAFRYGETLVVPFDTTALIETEGMREGTYTRDATER